MKFLIIEDHPVILLGIKKLIDESYPAATSSNSCNFPDGLNLLKNQAFDLLILDLNIPGGKDMEMISVIRQIQKDILILIYSGFDEKIYALPYIKAGADGYLSKKTTSEEFHEALMTLMKHEKYVSQDIKNEMLNNIGNQDFAKLKGAFNALSPREMTVMQLMSEGKWTKEIAIMLNVKENTISTFKRKIFDKLEVSNPIELSKKVSLLKNF
ncbi:response regulator transcription factor [Dyadobacter frigoris]|uniref:Response regulator transcription factor n=1 Tax=Dyadobacter frigoris TaxID=2576211 RepID=A0A4U6CYH1_9BACT|nr:response regulator transcription factor [Dyadobacter frigoris]TKT88801.1 response regulator transcription factor [Dyadobacter frigoris]GLU53998.1 DNA-binding response regulator [Dyadobacter frigoris]